MSLWKKYRPAILNKMKMCFEEPQEYQLSRHEFEAIGDRLNSGYSFNLEIGNGTVINNIEGTAVARDLFEVLKQSNIARELMQNNYFKINLAKNFILTIQTIK